MFVIDVGLQKPQSTAMLSHDEIREELIRQLDEKIVTTSAVAKHLGIPAPRVSEMRKRERKIQPSEMKKLAQFLGLSDADEVPVVGYVGGGAQVHPIDDYSNGDGMDFIERPEYIEGRAVAVQIKGDSMLPVAEDGWKLIYIERAIDEVDFLNRLCVVKLADDRMLVKKVLRGSQPKRYHLQSFNAPLIEDVAIKWAARVKSIVPA